MGITDQPLMKTDLPLPGRRQGKVRDIYEAKTTSGQDALLIIASDRISAFDVVMPNGIPAKGAMLTQVSKFWFNKVSEKFGDKLQHHLISTDAKDIADISDAQRQQIDKRVMVGRRSKVVPVECIVRGYLAGSGWKEYQKQGTVCGIKLPEGLTQCDKLPEPIFTPSTKEDEGHDENISFEKGCEIVGADVMTKLRDMSLAIYKMGHDYAAWRGIILADTKFEFGFPLDKEKATAGDLILIDEILTPDSSRFWPVDQYKAGQDQPSFDKQYVRNYLQTLVDEGKWGKQPPGPNLPEEIVQGTTDKYLQAYKAITGEQLDQSN